LRIPHPSTTTVISNSILIFLGLKSLKKTIHQNFPGLYASTTCMSEGRGVDNSKNNYKFENCHTRIEKYASLQQTFKCFVKLKFYDLDGPTYKVFPWNCFISAVLDISGFNVGLDDNTIFIP